MTRIVKRFNGEWFIIDQKKKFYGNLYIFENGDCKLETFKQLTNLKTFETGSEIKMICGQAREELSDVDFIFQLLDCTHINSSISKTNRFRYIVSYFLQSKSKNFINDLNFKSCIIELPNIKDWIGKSPTKYNLIDENEIEVKFIRPKTIILCKDENLIINLGFGYSLKQPDNQSLSLLVNPYLMLEMTELTSLTSFREKVREVQNFFSFIFDFPAYIANTSLSVGDGKPNDKYFFNLKNKFTINEAKKSHSTQMLIPYEIFISKNELLNDWFNFSKSNEYVSKNFFANFRRDNQFLENEFLNISLSIERYCKQHFPNKELSYFKKRLEFTLEFYKPYYKSFFVPDKSFSKVVTETRHHLIHDKVNYPEFVEKDPHKLYGLVVRLSFVMKSIILNRLNFTSKEAKPLLENVARRWVFFD